MPSKNPFEGREVVSRRGGPVKAPLSRDRIVAEALRVLAKEGPEGMSLRKVAVALQTGPASLYPYVEDLRGLRALVLDRALAKVDTKVSKRSAWRAQVKAILESYLTVLMEKPGLAQLAQTTIAYGPQSLRIVDALLGSLEEGDVDRRTAAWSVDLLLLYVTAIAAEQSHGLEPGSPEGPLSRALANASPADFPRVHAARDELISGEGPERFAWAIDVLVDGMLANRGKARRR